MKRHRILGEGVTFQHCMSRVIERRFILDDAGKRKLRQIMRKLEAFLDVEVVTYCLMSNHFHALLRIPDPEAMAALTSEELLERLSILYSKDTVRDVKQKLDRCGKSEEAKAWVLAPYQARMGKMDIFMKELKQRFSIWYNRQNGRRGTLWEDRYKSVLVEANEHALITMAAYIDLNPVRAKIVSDPKDYAFSGYGEAMGGGSGGDKARKGLGLLLEEALWTENRDKMKSDWRITGARYRMILFDHGEEREGDEHTGRGAKAGISREKVEAVIDAKGALPITSILRCRVRYFCDGAVFGASEFVESVFQKNREQLGLRRDTGARQMKGKIRWGDLRVMRDSRREPVERTV